MRFVNSIAGVTMFAFGATVASAQAPVRPSYGTAVTLETAKKLAAGAMAEAKKQSWKVRSRSSTTMGC